jgi:MoxR-like ATPase
LILAFSARRPLLVRGEPGTGKTQLARPAAAWLGWELHGLTIHPRIEASDLIYRFDAVKRLAGAQLGRADLIEADYWEPGPLWKAFGWSSASQYRSLSKHPRPEPDGHVVLLDEIDKADSDVPNSLLDVLGQWTFEVPQLGLEFGSAALQLPLFLITTNEERELPAAFIRRCIVLNLEPDPNVDYVDWLLMRGRAFQSGGAGHGRDAAGSQATHPGP